MKKLLNLFAIAAIAISLAACKQPNTEPAATTDTTTTTTPDPVTTPSDETVTKDYFISPVTSIANLEGSNWYFQTTIDDAATLTTLNLGNVATAITVAYTYKFKPYEEGEEQTGPKPGEFESDFKLTFKDTVPKENYEGINYGVRDSFPNFDFTWSTEGNNITVNISNTTALSAVFDNGSITITYPAQLAGEMNMNDGTEDVSLTLSQCYTIFYDGYIFTDDATPLDLTSEVSLTINTDYKKNGLNIDLTNEGIEKLISVFAEKLYMGLPMNETKFYMAAFENQLGYALPHSFIKKGNFIAKTDYTIAKNGYVIELTETGWDKFEDVVGEFYSFLEDVANNTGIYYDTKEIDIDFDFFETDDYTLNTDYRIVMGSVFLSDSGLEKLIAAIKEAENIEGNLYLVIYSEESTALFFEDEDLTYFTVSEDYNIWDNGLVVEFTEAGHSKMI